MNVALKKGPDWEVRKKWGSAVSGGETGFFAVPDVLVRRQYDLGISSTEMTVVLNILMHWWSADDLPYPRPSVIARRMGVSTRTVERCIESLEEKGLMQRKEAEIIEDGPSIRRFDLSGMVSRVNELAETLRGE